ncbi:terpene synthase family protein [Micromonospora echinofusca]|uniref:Terpene synthase n=1 Tax=Micromonospora echinofusca TaxID=47858 RepID=A0ABS3VP40_MICEH|nr:hypothetical protein [Micromonospora echinofusca]MBO4206256.1 hypothetical protein [Micromonospora echinofusca]
MGVEQLLVPCPFPDRSHPAADQAAGYVRTVAAEVGLAGAASATVVHSIALADAAAMTYPDAELDRLRVATLWIAFLVLFDDAWSDLLVVEGDWREQVRAAHHRIHRVLDGAGTGDDPLARLLARILDDIAVTAPDWDSSRLRTEIRRYLAATVWELEMRAANRIPDLHAYLPMRRVFSTMTVQRELDYYVCRLDLPEPVRHHPCLELVDLAVADYGCLANDLYSFDSERQHGITSNAITVLQHQYGWDVPTSVAQVQRMAAAALATFQQVSDDPPRFGLPDSDELRRYLDHYEAFMSAAARWPARSARYRTER